MTFELEANGVRFSCSSATVTRKLMEKGARLLDEAQAEQLAPAGEPAAPPPKPEPDAPG
jgi:hypothetical protein